jgi:alpha-D-ribose 1-methylphosphonate 5-triphosphate synthase subunit PhnG
MSSASACDPPASGDAHAEIDESRRALMSLLARASRDELRAGLSAGEPDPQYVEIRKPEVGLVMLRGRVGGKGAPFNLGEATVTRAAVRLATGETGFSYILGRDRERARLAALVDALWQCAGRRSAIERHVLTPIRARIEAEGAKSAAQAEATKVDFFTLVRGED